MGGGRDGWRNGWRDEWRDEWRDGRRQVLDPITLLLETGRRQTG